MCVTASTSSCCSGSCQITSRAREGSEWLRALKGKHTARAPRSWLYTKETPPTPTSNPLHVPQPHFSVTPARSRTLCTFSPQLYRAYIYYKVTRNISDRLWAIFIRFDLIESAKWRINRLSIIYICIAFYPKENVYIIWFNVRTTRFLMRTRELLSCAQFCAISYEFLLAKRNAKDRIYDYNNNNRRKTRRELRYYESNTILNKEFLGLNINPIK